MVHRFRHAMGGCLMMGDVFLLRDLMTVSFRLFKRSVSVSLPW